MKVDLDITSDVNRIRPKDSEVNRLYGDNKLLRDLTDWQPKYLGISCFEKGMCE